MKELVEGGEKAPAILPAVNQIELHPYVWGAYRANVEYCQSKVSTRNASVVRSHHVLIRHLTIGHCY